MTDNREPGKNRATIERQWAFARLVLQYPAKSASAIIGMLKPNTLAWSKQARAVEAMKWMDRCAPMIEKLREAANDALVISVAKRKMILSKIAEDIGESKLSDYVEASGGQGAFVTYGPESPRQMAVKELETMTKMDDSGDGVTMTTKIKLHSKSDAIAAIKELNDMENLYARSRNDDGAVFQFIVRQAKEPRTIDVTDIKEDRHGRKAARASAEKAAKTARQVALLREGRQRQQRRAAGGTPGDDEATRR